MKITIYELLNLVKDGKAPKMIKWGCHEFEYISDDCEYYCEDYGDFFVNLFTHDYAKRFLKDKVKIIEENKKIEKINNAYYHETQEIQNEIFKNKINELIDEINKLKEEK